MKKNSICIDITNVIPGKGGSGGGIATYAINLIKELDKILVKTDVVYLLKNAEFTGFGNFENLKLVEVNVGNTNIVSRLFWLYVRLPVFCLSKRIRVLHRIVPELPFIKVCKYVITLHDFMFDLYLEKAHIKKYLSRSGRLKNNFFKKMSDHAIKKSDGIIMPAQSIKNELESKFKITSKRILITSLATENVNGVSEKKSNQVLSFGMVAGFFPHKGHFRILQLADKLRKHDFNNFKIFFRGSQVDKAYIADVKNEITKYGLEDYIIFQPFESKISLKEIYESFDVVLLLSDYEGFGLPVLEAQSYSVPVVCSDIPIFREVLQESAFYLSLDIRDDEVLKLIETLKDNEKMKNLKEAGLNNLKKFSWHTLATKTLDFYKSFE